MSRKNGIWSYNKSAITNGVEVLIEDGKFTVDAYGYPINREYRLFDKTGKATRGWSKRID
ncbi:MAG: hypothetical protein AAF700_01165 [Pseudomonadota bacterium]